LLVRRLKEEPIKEDNLITVTADQFKSSAMEIAKPY
jgi:hypothetical protein